jgi:hypothetical protein
MSIIPPVNVASLVNKDTLNNLKSIANPKTFGDQYKKVAEQKIKQAATESTLHKLEKEKISLIAEEKQLDIQHQKKLIELQLNKTKELTKLKLNENSSNINSLNTSLNAAGVNTSNLNNNVSTANNTISSNISSANNNLNNLNI